jgi:hypothetical protein
MDAGIPLWDSSDPRNQILFEIRDKSGRIYGAARGSWSRGPRGGAIYTYYVYDILGNLVLETRREKDCRDEALFDKTKFITQRGLLTRRGPVNIDPQPAGARGGPLV